MQASRKACSIETTRSEKLEERLQDQSLSHPSAKMHASTGGHCFGLTRIQSLPLLVRSGMASALGSQDGRSCLHPNHLHCIPLIVDGDDAAGAATARPQFASPAPKNAKAERPSRRRLRRKSKEKQKKEE